MFENGSGPFLLTLVYLCAFDGIAIGVYTVSSMDKRFFIRAENGAIACYLLPVQGDGEFDSFWINPLGYHDPASGRAAFGLGKGPALKGHRVLDRDWLTVSSGSHQRHHSIVTLLYRSQG